LIKGFATTESQVIIVMGIVNVEDKPAAFHFRIAKLFAPAAGQLAFIEGKVHVLGRISMLVVDPQRAMTIGEGARREGI
jgi:hypothetical protein